MLWFTYIFGSPVSAELRFEKVFHAKNTWQVAYREWSDGLQQCVAENIQGDQVEFDLVVAANSI